MGGSLNRGIEGEFQRKKKEEEKCDNEDNNNTPLKSNFWSIFLGIEIIPPFFSVFD